MDPIVFEQVQVRTTFTPIMRVHNQQILASRRGKCAKDAFGRAILIATHHDRRPEATEMLLNGGKMRLEIGSTVDVDYLARNFIQMVNHHTHLYGRKRGSESINVLFPVS